MDKLAGLSQLLMDLQRAARSEAAEGFCDWALQRLAQLVPFDSASWSSGYVVPGEVRVLHSWHLFRQPRQMLLDYQAVGRSDVLLAAVVRQPGVTVAADSATWAPPQVRGYLQRYRIAHTAATCSIDARTGLITGVALWRADEDRPYTEDERQLIESAFPHLIEARSQNRLLHLVTASTPRQPGPWRPAAADTMGLLHHVDSEFTRLLLQEWPDWTGPYLPTPLCAAAGARTACRWAGREVVAKLTPLAELVLLQLRPCSAVDRLTPREKEVAAFTAQGLTHKEIARRLELSPATVRTHLTSSCRRLGVKSKSQLAAMVAEAE